MKADQIIPRYTYKDYASWQGDWELIDGYPYAMSPSPKMKHQFVSGNIYELIKGILSKKSFCNCKTVYELDWIIDDNTVVCPDIMIICGPVNDDFLRYPPTLIVEVLSDSTRLKDRNTKFALYEQQGVKYYLIADPTKKIIEIFELKNNRYQSNDELKVFDLHSKCQIELTLDSVFVD